MVDAGRPEDLDETVLSVIEALQARSDLPAELKPSDTIRPRPHAIAETKAELTPESKVATLIPRTDDLQYVRTLGEGGMGRVVLARQPSLNRGVAVKTTTDPDRYHALVSEAVITGMLEHPNIPPVHQLGEDDHGNPVLVMKRIEGATWAALLADPEHP